MNLCHVFFFLVHCLKLDPSRDGIVNLFYHYNNNTQVQTKINPGTKVLIKCYDNRADIQGPQILTCNYDGAWSHYNPRIKCNDQEVTIFLK